MCVDGDKITAAAAAAVRTTRLCPCNQRPGCRNSAEAAAAAAADTVTSSAALHCMMEDLPT